MARKPKKKKEETTMENNEIIVDTVETTEENINNEEVTETEVVETTEEVTETTVEGDQETTEVVETTEEVTETQEQPEIIQNELLTGKINGCEKLYVRKEASKDSEPAGIITSETVLTIDEENSTEDFYKVTTNEGLEGYCVKKFVKIN